VGESPGGVGGLLPGTRWVATRCRHSSGATSAMVHAPATPRRHGSEEQTPNPARRREVHVLEPDTVGMVWW